MKVSITKTKVNCEKQAEAYPFLCHWCKVAAVRPCIKIEFWLLLEEKYLSEHYFFIMLFTGHHARLYLWSWKLFLSQRTWKWFLALLFQNHNPFCVCLNVCIVFLFSFKMDAVWFASSSIKKKKKKKKTVPCKWQTVKKKKKKHLRTQIQRKDCFHEIMETRYPPIQHNGNTSCMGYHSNKLITFWAESEFLYFGNQSPGFTKDRNTRTNLYIGTQSSWK